MTESEVLEVRIGDEHITPEQIMDVNIGTYGPGDYVLPTGQKLEAQLLSNNSIRIFDGVMVYCGVRDVIAVNNYHDVTIENGQQGMNRNDIIVRHFEKNEETQFGGAEFQVIKGTATSGDATDPEITDTDLRAGALTHDMKLYRARLEGLNVVAVEPLFDTLPSIPELNGKISGAAGQIVYCGLVNLLYNSSTDLQGVVNDAPDDIFDNMSNYAVLLTLRNTSGTPYNQVDRLTYEVRTAQRVLVIDGYGSVFVSGHVVSVSVLIIKKL